MNPSILSKAKRPDILEQLGLGNFQEVIQLTNSSNTKGFWSFLKRTSEENGFAYSVLNASLLGKFEPNNFSQTEKLNLDGDCLGELSELFRIVLALEYYRKAPQYESQIAYTLLECVRNAAIDIEKKSNNYPTNSINAKVWMDGAGLRNLAGELSEYFKRKCDDKNELDALFLRAKFTLAIMSHYPGTVGPDMIAVALKYEALGNKEKAKDFYTPVRLDFTHRAIEIEEYIGESDTDFVNEDIPTVQSLIDSLEGLKRIGETIEEDLLIRSKSILKRLETLSENNSSNSEAG
jgi:hypothetical protein